MLHIAPHWQQIINTYIFQGSPDVWPSIVQCPLKLSHRVVSGKQQTSADHRPMFDQTLVHSRPMYDKWCPPMYERCNILVHWPSIVRWSAKTVWWTVRPSDSLACNQCHVRKKKKFTQELLVVRSSAGLCVRPPYDACCCVRERFGRWGPMLGHLITVH
jgi:hypothetical protein